MTLHLLANMTQRINGMILLMVHRSMGVVIYRRRRKIYLILVVSLSLLLLISLLREATKTKMNGLDLAIENCDDVRNEPASSGKHDLKFNSTKLLIYSFDGFASKFLLESLNRVENLIYWHEPMLLWERIIQKRDWEKFKVDDPLSINVTKGRVENPYLSSADFFNEVISCRFSSRIEEYFKYAVSRFPEYILPSTAISHVFRCKQGQGPVIATCTSPKNITNAINQLCKDKLYNIAIKVRTEIMPSLKTLYEGLDRSLKTDLKIVQLIRDPRAVMFDLSNHGQVPRNVYENDFQDKVRYICRKLSANINFATKVFPKNKYYVYNYENSGELIIEKLFFDIYDITFNHYPTLEGKKLLPHYDDLKYDEWVEKIPADFRYEVEFTCWDIIKRQDYPRKP